jgi:hypothetical protein
MDRRREDSGRGGVDGRDREGVGDIQTDSQPGIRERGREGEVDGQSWGGGRQIV